jgi:hypothetical protein
MATAEVRHRFYNESKPEEAAIFDNIATTFPKIYQDGIDLLEETAGKIQVMRLATEIFPFLKIEENKDSIREKVEKYRASLKSVNGQIIRAIELCSKVPESDVRVWQQETLAFRVYDVCQEYLPKLRDWNIHGTLLDKRFGLIMEHDQKHFNDSMSKFSSTVNPSSTSLLSSVAGFFTGWGGSSLSSAASADQVQRDDLLPLLENLNIGQDAQETKKKN